MKNILYVESWYKLTSFLYMYGCVYVYIYIYIYLIVGFKTFYGQSLATKCVSLKLQSNLIK